MKTKWKEKTAAERALLILRILISVVVIVLAALQLCGVWDNAINYAVPIVGLNLLVVSFQEWKKNRISSVVGFVCAVFILVCSIVVYFYK